MMNPVEMHEDDVRKAIEMQFRNDAVQRERFQGVAAHVGDNSAGMMATPKAVVGLAVPRANSTCRNNSDCAIDDLLVACAATTLRAQLREGSDRGKRGWYDPCHCNTHVLVAQLEQAVQKKDWASAATYAMMLHVRAVNHWN